MIELKAVKNEVCVSIEGAPWEVQAELQTAVASILRTLSENDGLPVDIHKRVFLEGLDLALTLNERKQPL